MRDKANAEMKAAAQLAQLPLLTQEEFQRLGEEQRRVYRAKMYESLNTLRKQQQAQAAKEAAAAAAAAAEAAAKEAAAREAAAAAQAAAAKAAAGAGGGGGHGHKRAGRLDGDCTLIASFSRDQITKHLNALRDENPVTTTPERLRQLILPLIDKLLSMQDGVIFAQPVDWLRRGLMDYPLIVLQPMDLGTIRKRLDMLSYYRSPREVAKDIRLVWANARKYNPPGHAVNELAGRFAEAFEAMWESIEGTLAADFLKATRNLNACSLCGGGPANFEPPTLYCNACSTRISKGGPYHTTRANSTTSARAASTRSRRAGQLAMGAWARTASRCARTTSGGASIAARQQSCGSSARSACGGSTRSARCTTASGRAACPTCRSTARTALSGT